EVCTLFPYTTLFRSRFLQEQTVRIRNIFAICGKQHSMKSSDIFNSGFDRKIFVLNPDFIPDFVRKRKKHNYTCSYITQNRPLGRSEEHTSELQSREN